MTCQNEDGPYQKSVAQEFRIQLTVDKFSRLGVRVGTIDIVGLFTSCPRVLTMFSYHLEVEIISRRSIG